MKQKRQQQDIVPSNVKSVVSLQRVVSLEKGSITETESVIPESIQSNVVRYTPRIPSELPTTNHVQYHLIFSTGCTGNQDWQSYLFFHQAFASGQAAVANVTRIVSGCATTQKQEELAHFFQVHIRPMAPDSFHLHFTPDFSNIKPAIKNYKYFNKPFGTMHWLEHALGYTTNLETHEQIHNPPHDDTIVILLDPDQLILRPFQDNDFRQDEWKFLKKGEIPRTSIEHGKPMAQMYGFGMQWKDKVTMDHVAAFDLPSPVDSTSRQDGQRGFIVGPPYIATARDMYAIAKQWSIFVPRVHDQYPHLLAEMFAYSLAACHLKLPHQTARSFMVSSVGAGNAEAWNLVDAIPNVCGAAADAHNTNPEVLLPRIFHFCQRYSWGPFSFGKHKFPNNFLSCESPLLAEPPPDVLHQYNRSFLQLSRQDTIDNPKAPKRQAFCVCTMIPAINQAALHFKQEYCTDNPKTNFSKIYVATRGHGLGPKFITY